MENLQFVKSQYVLHLNHSYKTHQRFYIMTELCNGGDLDMLRKAKGYLGEEECRLVLR